MTVPGVGQGLRDSVTAATLSASTVRYGTNVTVTARVNGAGSTPTGAVRVLAGDTLVGTGTLVKGRVTITVKTVDLGTAGTLPLTVRYDGDAEHRASDDELTLTVTKASSKVSVSLSPSTIKASSHAKVSVKLTASPSVPVTGEVKIEVTAGSKTYVSTTLAVGPDGRVTTTLPKLSKRTYTVRVSYAGSSSVESTSKTVTMKVR